MHFASMPTMLVVWPLLAAALVWTFPSKEQSGARGVALFAMLAELVLVLGRAWQMDWHEGTPQCVQSYAWIPSAGIQWAVGLDGISMLMIALTALLAPVALLSSLNDVEHKSRDYAACLLVLEAALIGGFVARDLFLFYTFWEAMLVPAYFLVGMWGGEHSPRATTRFFLYTMSASMLMLIGIIAASLAGHQGETPSFLLTDVQQQLGQIDLGLGEGLLFFAFALALLVKVPLLPLHGWMPDTYSEAPCSSLPLISGVMVKLGAIGFLRFALLLFPRAATFCLPTIMASCVAGCLYAAWLASGQSRMRRVLAYSSMSHMSLCVLAMTAMTPLSVTGSVVQMVNHGINAAALFVLVGMIEKRCRTDHFSELGGLATDAPMLATSLGIAAFAMIGLPGLNGFVGEFMLLAGSYQSDGLGVVLTEGVLAQGGIVLVLTLGALATMRVLYLLWALESPTWHSGVGRALRLFAGVVCICGVTSLVILPIGDAPGGVIMRLLAPFAGSSNPLTVPAQMSVIIATTSVVFAAVYMLRLLERTLFGPAAAHRPHVDDLSPTERVVVFPLLALMVLFGVYPAPLIQMAEPTATAMVRYFREGAGWPSATVTPVFGAAAPSDKATGSVRGLPAVSGEGVPEHGREVKAAP